MIVDIPFPMITLRRNFRKNNLEYNLVKRTDTVAMYSVGGRGYEVFDIPVEGPTIKGIKGENLILPHRERILSNEEFGKRFRSAVWIQPKNAELYFDYLTSHKPSSKITFDKYRERLNQINAASS